MSNPSAAAAAAADAPQKTTSGRGARVRGAMRLDMDDLGSALAREAANTSPRSAGASSASAAAAATSTPATGTAAPVQLRAGPTAITKDWLDEELLHWEEERKKVAQRVSQLQSLLAEEEELEEQFGGSLDTGGTGSGTSSPARRDSKDSPKNMSPAALKRIHQQAGQRRTIGVGQPHSHFFAEELAEMRKQQERAERLQRLKEQQLKAQAAGQLSAIPAHLKADGAGGGGGGGGGGGRRNSQLMGRAGNRGSIILSMKERQKALVTAAPKEPYTLENDPTRPAKAVPPPEHRVLGLEDIVTEAGTVRCGMLRDHFLKEGRLTVEAAQWLCQRASEIMRQEPNLLRLEAPINVVGDIHGQYYDLIFLLEQAGDPETCRYLFLGDYVDRGCFGCETTLYLFALKITHPRQIFMLRGNHESRLLAQHFNFESEAIHKYDEETHDAIQDAFDTLPLCALLTADCGRFFAVHGGLSPEMVLLDDILPVDRFCEPPEKGPFCDLLWSDPAEETAALGLSPSQLAQWHRKSYDPNPVRGCSYIYGYAAVEKFLADNDLRCIIRAHEVQKQGYKLHRFCRPGQQDPLVVTLFSAPNYCDIYENWGAWITLTNTGYTFGQIAWSEHPYWLPRFQNALNFTFPFVLENLMRCMADVLTAVGELGHDEEEKEADDATTKRVRAMGRLAIMMKKYRVESEDSIKELEIKDKEAFSTALRFDLKNEGRPRGDTKTTRKRAGSI